MMANIGTQEAWHDAMLAGGKEVKKVKVVIKTDEYGTEQHTGGTVEMWSDRGEDSTHDFGDGLNLVGDFRGNKTAAIDIKLRDSRKGDLLHTFHIVVTD